MAVEASVMLVLPALSLFLCTDNRDSICLAGTGALVWG